MWDDTASMFKAIGSDLDDMLNLGYLSCDIELQDSAAEKLGLLAHDIDAYRLKAISNGQEDSANHAWVAHNAVKGAAAFLSMWTHLKRDQFGSAWECLVEAEDRITAMLGFRQSPRLADVVNRLLVAERLLFPPTKYISSSITIKSFACSICDSEYGTCCHISGRLYMGELCIKVARDLVAIDHVAFVDHPEDKFLRVLQLTDRNKCPCRNCVETQRERKPSCQAANHTAKNIAQTPPASEPS